jgi:hypothetical protein
MHRDGDRLLQLLIFNEEFLVSASHQLVLIASLPFVHTARRSYRLGDPVNNSDRSRWTNHPLFWKVSWTLLLRGRRSRNKVSVGEPAEGSFVSFNNNLSWCLTYSYSLYNSKFKLSTMDVSGLSTKKSAANCDKQHDKHFTWIIRFLNANGSCLVLQRLCLVQCHLITFSNCFEAFDGYICIRLKFWYAVDRLHSEIPHCNYWCWCQVDVFWPELKQGYPLNLSI